MGQALSHPVQSQLLQRTGNGNMRAGSAEMQGFRLTMEDTHTLRLQLSPTHPNLSYFGVYDGHAGEKCSLFLADRLWRDVASLSDPTAPTQLSERMVATDLEYLSNSEDKQHGSASVFALVRSPTGAGGAEAKSATATAGTTAAAPAASSGAGTTTTTTGSTTATTTATGGGGAADDRKWGVTVANVGDSRVMLIRGGTGECVPLTNDHKPDLPLEKARIVAAGGFVSGNRVDGQLAMSRAFGDSPYKLNPKLKPEEQKVIAVPEITTETAYAGDAMLICCDGIFEALSNEQVAAFVHAELKTTPDDPAAVAGRLLTYSLQQGSKDNHSAMIVQFKSGEGYERKDEFIAGPFRPFQRDKKFVEAYFADAAKFGYKGKELLTMAEKAEATMPEIKDDDDEGPGMAGLQSLEQQLGGLQGDQRQKLMALTAMLQGMRGGAPGSGAGAMADIFGPGFDVEMEDDAEGDDSRAIAEDDDDEPVTTTAPSKKAIVKASLSAGAVGGGGSALPVKKGGAATTTTTTTTTTTAARTAVLIDDGEPAGEAEELVEEVVEVTTTTTTGAGAGATAAASGAASPSAKKKKKKGKKKGKGK